MNGTDCGGSNEQNPARAGFPEERREHVLPPVDRLAVNVFAVVALPLTLEIFRVFVGTWRNAHDDAAFLYALLIMLDPLFRNAPADESHRGLRRLSPPPLPGKRRCRRTAMARPNPRSLSRTDRRNGCSNGSDSCANRAAYPRPFRGFGSQLRFGTTVGSARRRVSSDIARFTSARYTRAPAGTGMRALHCHDPGTFR